MSERNDQGGPDRGTRRPAPPREGFVGWSDFLARWLAVGVFAIVAIMLLVYTVVVDVRFDVVLHGGRDRSGAVVHLVLVGVALATLVLMAIMAVYVNGRLALKSRTLDAIGTIVFYGLVFSFPLLVLGGPTQLSFALLVAVAGWWLRVRTPLRDELPVTAGGRRPRRPRSRRQAKKDVVTRPPRSWEPDGGKRPAPAAKRRRKGKKRRSG